MTRVHPKPRVSIAVASLLLVASVLARAGAGSAEQSAASAFDGVFTKAQSDRGKAKYAETCERCHKEDLAGDEKDEVPPLVGDKFLAEWTSWTIGDLFEFSTMKMPPKRKDRAKISEQDYVDVLAFILERNGFPAGEAELVPVLEPLLEIEMSASE